MDKYILSEEEIKRLFHIVPDNNFREVKTKKTPSPLHTDLSSKTSLPPQEDKRLSHPSHDAYMPSKYKFHSTFQRLSRAIAAFGFGFFVSFGLLSGQTFLIRVGYWWNSEILGQEILQDESWQMLTASNQVNTSYTTPVDTSPPPLQLNQFPANQNNLPLVSVYAAVSTNRLIIPKISVNTPVVWNSNPANILQDLQNGVAHYGGTSLPNKTSGNVFITGHSSGFVWDRSPYTTVFANLDKLVAGDLIALTTDNEEYIYRVSDSIVVRPNETFVLLPTPSPTLSLMTCVPVGTNLRRLIVRADLYQVIRLSNPSS